jgi:MGT family glycosyltransferase
MTHIGLLCLPVPGHLNPMAALGRELQGRGHRVTFFGILDSEAMARAEGLDFQPLGALDFPKGSLPRLLGRLGELQGPAALRFTGATILRGTTVLCREAPTTLTSAGVEALLVDMAEPAGGTVADHLGLPFVTIGNALALNEEPAIPPVFTSWGYGTNWIGPLRNRAAYALLYQLARPITAVLNGYRRQWKLPCVYRIEHSFSRLAQISQLPKAFDFPRRGLPSYFHYTGPFRLESYRPIPFPYDRLAGRPFIYASLGTLQNRVRGVYQAIAAACEGMDIQVVISLGGGGAEQFGRLPGNPLVVGYAPQPELISMAALTMTHGGLNTVLESLAHGVPLVAIPITNDQPGVGARLQRSGAGEVVSLSSLSVPCLRAAVRRVLRDPAYRKNATTMQAAIRRSGGVRRAADIVESAFADRRPVTVSD